MRRNELEHIQAYDWLRATVEILKDFPLVSYDAKASTMFESLRKQKLRIGTADMRIAAIALSLNATVVTANTIHFGQIPNLQIEDWTK